MAINTTQHPSCFPLDSTPYPHLLHLPHAYEQTSATNCFHHPPTRRCCTTISFNLLKSVVVAADGNLIIIYISVKYYWPKTESNDAAKSTSESVPVKLWFSIRPTVAAAIFPSPQNYSWQISLITHICKILQYVISPSILLPLSLLILFPLLLLFFLILCPLVSFFFLDLRSNAYVVTLSLLLFKQVATLLLPPPVSPSSLLLFFPSFSFQQKSNTINKYK